MSELQIPEKLVESFTNADYFTIQEEPDKVEQVHELMAMRKVIAVVVIPQGFSESLHTKAETDVQVIVDGSNANTATIAINYIKNLVTSFSTEKGQHKIEPLISLEPRIWYNPDLKSAHFIVPGLVAVLMTMICAILTSVTIVREKETGTMEQILVSPIKSHEIIIGKVAPYIIIGLIISLLVILLGQVVFNVPMRGNLFLLLVFTMIFIYASLSLGVFISTTAQTQQVALMLSIVGTLLPSLLLSGFMFPIYALPIFLRVLSMFIPAKYYLVIIRGIMLKGIDHTYLYLPAIYLVVFGTLLLSISIKRFKTKLED